MRINDYLKAANKTNYLRTADFNRAIALTKFMLYLEDTYKTGFKLLSGSIKRLQCRHIKNGSYWKDTDPETEQPSFTNFAGFIVNGTKYYLEIKDNPFFESYITYYENVNPHYRECTERLFAFETLTDGSNTIETMFNYNGDKNINKLFNDMKESFKNLKKDNYTTCIKLNDTTKVYY